jgi:hypothetical protein
LICDLAFSLQPVLAICGVTKPGKATSLAWGFAPCISPKHAFSSRLQRS